METALTHGRRVNPRNAALIQFKVCYHPFTFHNAEDKRKQNNNFASCFLCTKRSLALRKEQMFGNRLFRKVFEPMKDEVGSL